MILWGRMIRRTAHKTIASCHKLLKLNREFWEADPALHCLLAGKIQPWVFTARHVRKNCAAVRFRLPGRALNTVKTRSAPVDTITAAGA